MSELAILCVTRAEPHSWMPLRAMLDHATRLGADFVIAADGEAAVEALAPDLRVYAFRVESKGFIESVLETALGFCRGAEFILRLDDDERCSPAMVEWLASGRYRTHDHWSIPTANLWTPTHLILNPPLWPNAHERLSVRGKAGGRKPRPHARCPYGVGELAPVALEHHKFLLKSFEERQAIAARYDTLRPGAGTGQQLPYSLPELAFDSLTLAPLGDGSVHAGTTWGEAELVVEQLRRPA